MTGERKRPLPLWYRGALLWVATVLDRRVQAIRAHVRRHTPIRPKRMTATEVIETNPAVAIANRALRTLGERGLLECTCPPSERPPLCQHKYALGDCLRVYNLRVETASQERNAL